MKKYITELSPTTARLTLIEENVVYNDKGEVISQINYPHNRYFRQLPGKIFEYFPENDQRGQKLVRNTIRDSKLTLGYFSFLSQIGRLFNAKVLQEQDMDFYIWKAQVKMERPPRGRVVVTIPEIFTYKNGDKSLRYEKIVFDNIEGRLHEPIQDALTAGDAAQARAIALENQEKSILYRKKGK